MAVATRLKDIPLWSEKWGTEALRTRKAAHERSYRRGFELVALSDDEITFPSFRTCYTPGLSLGEIQRGPWPKVAGVDLSGPKRPGNAIVVVAVEPVTRRRFPCDVRFGAWKSNETCEQISDLDRAYNLRVVMVEDNGYQGALIDWAQAEKGRHPWWMKVEPTTTGRNKKDLELGLPGLQVEFHNQAWSVPSSEFEGATPEDEGVRGQWARWDYEFRNHPLASTTDGVMATWFARQGIDMIVSYLEQAGDSQVGDLNAR